MFKEHTESAIDAYYSVWTTICIGFMVFAISLLCGYSLVFAAERTVETKILFQGGGNMYLDSELLRRTYVILQSGNDEEKLVIDSECGIRTGLKGRKKTVYFFEIIVPKDTLCKKETLEMKTSEGDVLGNLYLSIRRKEQMLTYLLDYSDKEIIDLMESLTWEKASDNGNSEDVEDPYSILEEKRKQREKDYFYNVLSYIVESRGKPYIMPVPGKDFSQAHAKLPNAWRPYREEYTNGVHQWWDIDTKLGDTVVSLDDALVLRVVSDFEPENLNNLKLDTSSLTEEDKLLNLDILRGNQVWLKTMKWDVIFYSHLGTISQDIIEGTVIKKWDVLGTVGVSGIPGDAYDDYHLHFELYKNPFEVNKRGKY